MPIPDYQTAMLPLLQQLADGKERTVKDVNRALERVFDLTEAETQVMLASGQQTVFHNRMGWAKTYLKAAGLIESPRRGVMRITAEGRSVIAQKRDSIDLKFLEQFPGYIEFRDRSKKSTGPVQPAEEFSEVKVAIRTPLESLNEAYDTIREGVKEELLTRLKACSPSFFERTVMKLLQAMGYGAVTGDGQVTGKSGDAGIDGVIREDKLGLDVVCIQAKRWEGTVGRPIVQQFVGSMDYIRAKKGVILTTSGFSKEAVWFVDRIEGKKVVLIDGIQLAEFMLQYSVGVTTTEVYTLKEVSNDFFDEDEG